VPPTVPGVEVSADHRDAYAPACARTIRPGRCRSSAGSGLRVGVVRISSRLPSVDRTSAPLAHGVRQHGEQAGPGPRAAVPCPAFGAGPGRRHPRRAPTPDTRFMFTFVQYGRRTTQSKRKCLQPDMSARAKGWDDRSCARRCGDGDVVLPTTGAT
jgi:hypothetical protein